MHYRELEHTWFMNGETSIIIDKLEKLIPGPIPTDCSESHGVAARKPGAIAGQIVEAATVGNPFLWKTDEIMIHKGGNEFKRMSVVDDHIFKCALLALKTGQLVQVTYDDRIVRDPITQNTTFNVVGIASVQ